MKVASPSGAVDSGAAVGITFGYEVQPHFAMELTFSHFPTSTLTFTQGNYYFDEENDVVIDSETDAMWFVAKFMAQIADLPLRGYATAGLDVTYRNDVLATIIQAEPTFGVGLDYIFRNRIQLELGFQYVAGYGEASVTPANAYVPFLYTVFMRLGYYI
ncbi:MAG: hypothetical protein A3J38_10570 [Gammaproteobacteria bacterium RIFCSPHIGHO2_12_FULL_45_9]|nr:MAG: hypothetical protein A3J38_10570 [Gammaproteobacteria bacterium RIFCSPHIGHO2_12_FULL_45_9]